MKLIWLLVVLVSLAAIAAYVWLSVEAFQLKRDLERWEQYRDEHDIHPDYSPIRGDDE